MKIWTHISDPEYLIPPYVLSIYLYIYIYIYIIIVGLFTKTEIWI